MRLLKRFFPFLFPCCLVFLGFSLFLSGCTSVPAAGADGAYYADPATQPTVKVLTPAAEQAVNTAQHVGEALTATAVPPLVQVGGLITALAGLVAAWNQSQKKKAAQSQATAAQAKCQQLQDSHEKILSQMTAALRGQQQSQAGPSAGPQPNP